MVSVRRPSGHGADGKGGSRGSRRGGGSAKARRSAARLASVQALYQIELTGTVAESVLGEFIKHRLGHEVDGVTYVAADPQLFADIVRGTSARRPQVDEMLTGTLEGSLQLDRMELLLRAILRAGAYELLGHADIHARIIISEYVEVARAFFAGREAGLVNGVLDRLARTLRPEEMTTGSSGSGDA